MAASYATPEAFKLRAGITDTTDDVLIGQLCDDVNAYVESVTGRVVGPLAGTAYTLDCFEPSQRLLVPIGVVSLTSVELAQYTGAAFETLAATDWFLRPAIPAPGWPYTELWISDRPTGSFAAFPVGFGVIRLTGSFGWSEIPDELADVAVTTAMRAWQARGAGAGDIVGTDDFGRPVVSRFLSARDRDTLRAYTVSDRLA